MRIGLITHSFLPVPGGLEWKVHYLATEYSARGHEVVVFCQAWPRAYPRRLEIVPRYEIVRFLPRPFPGAVRLGIFKPFYVAAIMQRHRQKRFDILHCHSVEVPTSYGVSVRQMTGVPVVATTCGHDILVHPAIRFGVRRFPDYDRLVRKNLRGIEAVGSISGATRREIEAVGTTARILDIPNGLDWQAFQRPESNWLKRNLALPTRAVVVLSLGRCHPQKGYDIGLQAFARARPEVSDAHYVIVGENTSRLHPMIADLGLQDRVHLLENQPMDLVPEILRSSDLLFSPSRLEGFAQVVVQAMACARPCVLSDCAGNEDFQGHPGALVGRAEDPAALGELLSRVLSSDSLRKQMGAAAYAGSRRYGWDRIADEYCSAFGDLAGLSKSAGRGRT